MTVRERLADIADFLRRPRFVPHSMPWGGEAARTFAVVFVLSIMIAPAIAGVTALIDAQAEFLPQSDLTPRTMQRRIIDFLIIAPIFEELLFRSWLTGRRAGLRFALYGAVASLLMLAGILFWPEQADITKWVSAGIVVAGLMHWGRTSERDAEVPGWFVRHFGWFLWGSSLAFGLVHLGNFAGFVSPLGVLVVLPQTVGGILLAYTRTRLGLRAAVAHHALFNAVWLLADLAVA